MAAGKFGQAVAKFDAAAQKLAQAQADDDVVNGKIFALCAMSEKESRQRKTSASKPPSNASDKQP